MLPSVVVVSTPAPAVLEMLPVGYGVELDVVSASVLDDDAAGVLPPLVPDADVLPMLPPAVVVSAPAPAVLEVLAIGHGVELDAVSAGELDDDAAGVLPPLVPDADVLPILSSTVVVSALLADVAKVVVELIESGVGVEEGVSVTLSFGTLEFSHGRALVLVGVPEVNVDWSYVLLCCQPKMSNSTVAGVSSEL
jgi:hypothetical protein